MPDGFDKLTGPLLITISEDAAAAVRDHGQRSVRVVKGPSDIVDPDGRVLPELELWREFVILIPEGHENARDAIAMNLGDWRCRWAYLPTHLSRDTIGNALELARLMWTDEIATLDDIPDPEPEATYLSGFDRLDEHGFRITLPAFMPVIGPYGSGKSVFLRQLLVNLYRIYGWRCLLTSFEERVKPRYHRDLRRHLIGKPVDQWTDTDAVKADAHIRRGFRFLRRPRRVTLDMDRLLDRIDFAARVHQVRVVCIDPVNEIDHQVPKGESKTDYMGRFIMNLKALADDHNLLMICCAHPPKDGVEKRLSKRGLLTLNDGADTAHWGNKADIGLCLWRNLDGPTMLHIDKLKDHETMGHPTLAEMHLDNRTNTFRIGRMGYDILADQENAA